MTNLFSRQISKVSKNKFALPLLGIWKELDFENLEVTLLTFMR